MTDVCQRYILKYTLFYFSSFKKLKMALTSDQITNITRQTISEFKLDEENDSKNIEQILKMHGNQQFYILRYVSFCKNFLILSKVGKYTIEVPSLREHYFVDRLSDSCFIQVKNRGVEKVHLNSEYYNEIYLTIDVFR